MTRLSKLHMILGLAAGLLVIGSHAQTIAQGSLNIGGSNANFGVHRLNGGFMPDPMTVSVVSGGSLNVRNMGLGAGCTGYATSNPDVILQYNNAASFLRFFVRASGDTASGKSVRKVGCTSLASAVASKTRKPRCPARIRASSREG